MTNVFDTLHERGFVHNVSSEAGLRAALDIGPIRPYCGYDPTADSLHVGHLVTIMMLSHFDHTGHQPVALVGGATGLIGDPTGKNAQRTLLSQDQVDANLVALKSQLASFIDFGGGAAMVNNADWLTGIGYIEFLRDIAIHFSVNQMLRADTNRSRLEAGGLSLTEFNYMCLQAYDFLHLFRAFGCRLQVGGSDQWSNSLAGADLIRRVESAEGFVLTSPLITTASGAKMGKTEAGAVWLDPTRTSPFEYFQFWTNTEDADVDRFLRLFTFVPLPEIADLACLEGADLRRAKDVLAFEATSIVHGQHHAQQARTVSQAIFRGEVDAGDGVPSISVSAADIAAGISGAQLLVTAGLCASLSEARRLVSQGGAYLDRHRLQDADAPIPSVMLDKHATMLRAGKKRHRRIVVGS